MGQTLSEPVTEKHTSSGGDETLSYAVSEMQGWRISMEDAHATILSLDDGVGDQKVSFFAVYDGHGGSTVAKFSGETLHKRLAETEEYKLGLYEKALKRAFLQTDEDLRANPKYSNDPSGCTAVAALLVPSRSTDEENPSKRQILVANAGDSRSVLSYKGKAEPMSHDHKPTNPSEHYRIMEAGGFVEFGRVNGNLALSRAIGDFEFKRNFGLEPEDQIVTANPDIIVHIVTGEEEFLVLACDGIWDCLDNQDVVDFVRRSIANFKELQDICEELMDRCLAPDSEIGGIGCDNMTVCIVALLGDRTKEEWYLWVKERVDDRYGWDTPLDIDPVFQRQSAQQGGQSGFGGVGGGGVLSALAGGLGARDDADGARGIRLPDGLASALGGAGIVFRPGSGTDEDGEVVYEAHVVDEDDSSDDSEHSSAIKELDDAKEHKENNTNASATVPEIVDSPGEVSKSSETGPKSTHSDDTEVDAAATKAGTS